MYLTAKKYISAWEHHEDEKKSSLFKNILKEAGVSFDMVDSGSPSGNIDFHIGYWRKANAIHNWFVQHVQEGKDECQLAYVGMKDLLLLKSVCESILSLSGDMEKMKMLVQEVLPPRAGFFFGSTDVDDWYLNDLKHTISVIEKCEKLKEEKEGDWSFYYQSSW